MSPVPLPYPPQPLNDERVSIRPWTEADLDCVRQASDDPRIPEGTSVPKLFTPAEGLAFIHRQWSRARDGVGVSQAIVENGTDQAVGLVFVALRPQPHVGGLGYWVVPSARGQGIATAAVRLVSAWALNAFGLQRLEAWVEPDNVPSRRVLANAGFHEEGRLRRFLSTPAGPSDALVYSVVPTSNSSTAT